MPTPTDPEAERLALSCLMRGAIQVHHAAREKLAPDMFFEYHAAADAVFRVLRDGGRPDVATIRSEVGDVVDEPLEE